MNTITQANQLRGFVESLKLSDNISKAQLEMLFSKLRPPQAQYFPCARDSPIQALLHHIFHAPIGWQ